MFKSVSQESAILLNAPQIIGKMSFEKILISFRCFVSISNPTTLIELISFDKSEPMLFFIVSTVLSPKTTWKFSLTKSAMFASIWTPPTLIVAPLIMWLLFIMEMSVTPPPTLTTMCEFGSFSSTSIPINAQTPHGINAAFVMFNAYAKSLILFFSSLVKPQAWINTTRFFGLPKPLGATFFKNSLSINFASWKFAITPSTIGKNTSMLLFVLPTSFLASIPTHFTTFLLFTVSIAMQLGSFSATPKPAA